MRTREQMDGMMMFLRAQSGEPNIIENIEIKGQPEVINRVRVQEEWAQEKKNMMKE